MTALAPSMACHAHSVLYPFLEGEVDGVFAVDGAVAVSCKRALRRRGWLEEDVDRRRKEGLSVSG